MSTAESPTSVSPDRSSTLIFAGVLQILLGCLCLLMAAIIVAASQLPPPPRPNGQAVTAQTMNTQAMAIYLIAAVAFIWMGVGLARARRWAWTLTVVLSWTWLIVGVCAFVMVMCLMGQLTWDAIAEQGKIPPAWTTPTTPGYSVARCRLGPVFPPDPSAPSIATP